MRYAIISDIHANEIALRAVISDARGAAVKRIVCLGDIVGYGPQPRETLALIRATAAMVVAGNHDDAVCGRQSADAFIDLASDAVTRHRAELSAEELAYLRALPYECAFEDAIVTHGDFTAPKAFNYVENTSEAEACFKARDAALMFVGHTHTPAIFVTGQSGSVYQLDAQDFVLEDGKRYLVNPGSVGYPRANNGECYSSYVIYDSTARTIEFRRLPFAISSVMQRGRDIAVAKPKRWIPLAVAAGVAMAIGAGWLFLNVPGKRGAQDATGTPHPQERAAAPAAETAPTVATAPTAPTHSLVISNRCLTLPPNTKYVYANLYASQKYAKVNLIVEFKSAKGEILSPCITNLYINKSYGKLKVPANSVTASFTILRPTADAKPRIKTFDPSLKAKGKQPSKGSRKAKDAGKDGKRKK